MFNRRFVRMSAAVAALFLIALIGCVVVETGNGGPPSISFAIGSKTFTFTLDAAKLFELRSGVTQQKEFGVQLFTNDATDNPRSAAIQLNANRVSAVLLGEQKGRENAQTISRTVEINVLIGPSDIDNPCEAGVAIGTFVLTIDNGVVSVDQSSLEVPLSVLPLLISGQFTICLEVTATIDVTLTIEELDCVFGPSDDGDGGGTNGNANDNGNGNDNGGDPNCTVDADCATGESCTNGQCVPATSACVADTDCASGETCDGGTCVPAPSGCTSDGDCAAGETCDVGVCVAAPGACTADSDCAAGETCDVGVCVAGPGGCTADSDCAAGETCTNGACVPATPACVDNTDCAADEICTSGQCVSPPAPQFTLAEITRIGAEHLIAGQDADPNLSFQSPAGYAPGPFGAKSSVLSGDGNKVWWAMFDAGPNVEGDPQMQLWSVNTDGSGALRSSFPMEILANGLHLTTNLDGSVVVADNVRTDKFYKATPGTGASLLYSYNGIADARGAMRISDDGTQFIYVNVSQEDVVIADISVGSPTPQVLITTDSLEANGFTGGRPQVELDINSSATRWMMGIRVFGSDARPNLWPIFIGDGLAFPTVSRVATERDDISFSRFNMTDDGQTIAYCRESAFNGPVGRCFIQEVGSSARTEIVDEVSVLKNLSLADNGSKAYMSTISSGSNDQGFIYDVATGERYTGGSQWFSGSAPFFSDVKWSDDGRLFMAAVSGGIYVLHDGSVPAGFPTIDRILYRMNDDACTMTVRVEVNAPIGIERIFTLGFYRGLNASRGEIPGEENPFSRGSTGGGVNKSTTFTLVETGVWEREVFLTNSDGECASSLLSADFSIRIILVEETKTRTVFADFVPVP